MAGAVVDHAYSKSAGRARESDHLLAQISQLAPHHPAVLNELGVRMLLRGDMEKASELFQRAVAADPNSAALWSNLAGGRRLETAAATASHLNQLTFYLCPTYT